MTGVGLFVLLMFTAGWLSIWSMHRAIHRHRVDAWVEEQEEILEGLSQADGVEEWRRRENREQTRPD